MKITRAIALASLSLITFGSAIDTSTADPIVPGIIADEPDPFLTGSLATPPFAGTTDATIHSESGHLWVTWIEDASHVGWSGYSPATQRWLKRSFL